MLFSKTVNTETHQTVATKDADEIRLSGGYRLPSGTKDSGKIRLGGGYRAPKAA